MAHGTTLGHIKCFLELTQFKAAMPESSTGKYGKIYAQ